jgi:hypothetical protein
MGSWASSMGIAVEVKVGRLGGGRGARCQLIFSDGIEVEGAILD